jgi:hypothetical protein
MVTLLLLAALARAPVRRIGISRLTRVVGTIDAALLLLIEFEFVMLVAVRPPTDDNEEMASGVSGECDCVVDGEELLLLFALLLFV